MTSTDGAYSCVFVSICVGVETIEDVGDLLAKMTETVISANLLNQSCHHVK